MNKEDLDFTGRKNSSKKYAVDETPEDDYDPHLHRNIPHSTTNLETFIHMFKGILGTGVFAMPEAFKHAGILNGAISTILIGIICTYGMHLLIQTQYIICKRLKIPLITYPESMKIALLSGPKCLHPVANASGILVDVLMVIYQIGTCCCYVIFVAAHLKKLMDECECLPKTLSIEVYTAILLIPFILILLIPNLKYLVPFSVVSNFISVACFVFVFFYIFQDLPPISHRPLVGTFYSFSLYFGTTVFAIEAIGVIVVLENNMKTPKSFGGLFGVFNLSMFLVTLIYIIIGFVGYWQYGEDVKSSVTLNFPAGDMLAKTIQGGYSLAIFISYGLQGFVAIDIMWNTYLAPKLANSKFATLYEYILRILTVLLTFLLAITVPFLGLIISLFGSFCLTTLGIIFPAIMEICVKWNDNLKLNKSLFIKNLLLIVFGLGGLISGSSCAISEIINQLYE